jgi:hypothetical protein
MSKKKTTNPWSAAAWDLRGQQKIISAMGIERANQIASRAVPPSFVGADRVRWFGDEGYKAAQAEDEAAGEYVPRSRGVPY